ncbi:unnamed protein product [Auanema sp. JU1783]|nr:unnamed protein product [Auanema sp. JU1783]
MGESNVFNTFSFNKWASSKKEEEIGKESRRRRDLQMKRLKERLAHERQLREAGGDGDLDLEALIEALQKGDEINGEGINLPTNAINEASDDFILDEIRRYENTHTGPPGTSSFSIDSRFWKYNRRQADLISPEEREQKSSDERNKLAQPADSLSFKYNRFVTKT